MGKLKIIGWNVNGLRAILRKGDLNNLLEKEDPDILAMQEIKMQIDQLEESFEPYHMYINSAEKKGYSGTMVLSKQEPLNVTYGIPGDHPQEGRVITLEYPDFYFVNAYVPNSKDGLLRIDYRMYFEDCMREYLSDLDQKKPVIYTGDLNVAHNEIDLKNPETNHHNPGFSDQEREKFTSLLNAGFVDSFRELYPEEVKYSWWSYRMKAREKGIGWRIDYFVISKRFLSQVEDSKILNEVMGSDHCPVELIIK